MNLHTIASAFLRFIRRDIRVRTTAAIVISSPRIMVATFLVCPFRGPAPPLHHARLSTLVVGVNHVELARGPSAFAIPPMDCLLGGLTLPFQGEVDGYRYFLTALMFLFIHMICVVPRASFAFSF
jgi:hypothetical protein